MASTNARNLEWKIIQECIEGNKTVRIFMKNGFQMVCRIKDQDQVVILVEESHGSGNYTKSIIYKDGISTITGF